MNIKIKCTSGIALSLSEMVIYNANLKKHSMLELEQMIQNIEQNGFTFPIAISRLNGNNYIVDGELRYLAITEMRNRGYEVSEIPIFYVKVKNENELRERIIAASATFHVITKKDYQALAEGTEIELKNYCLPEGSLIDFYTLADVDRFFEKIKKEKKTEVDYAGLLRDGAI